MLCQHEKEQRPCARMLKLTTWACGHNQYGWSYIERILTCTLTKDREAVERQRARTSAAFIQALDIVN